MFNIKEETNKCNKTQENFDFTKGDIEDAKHGIDNELLANNRNDGLGFEERIKLTHNSMVEDIYVYHLYRHGDIIKSLEFINAEEFGEDSKVNLYIGENIIETYLNNQEKVIPLNGYGIPLISLSWQTVYLIVYSKVEPEIYINYLYCSNDYRKHLASTTLNIPLSNDFDLKIENGVSQLLNKNGVKSGFNIILERGLPIGNNPYKLQVPMCNYSTNKIQIKYNFLKNTTNLSLYMGGNLIFKLDRNLLKFLIKSQLHSEYIDILSPFLQCIPNHLRKYHDIVLKIYNNKDKFSIDTLLYKNSDTYTSHSDNELLTLDIKIPYYIRNDNLIYKYKKLKFLHGFVTLE